MKTDNYEIKSKIISSLYYLDITQFNTEIIGRSRLKELDHYHTSNIFSLSIQSPGLRPLFFLEIQRVRGLVDHSSRSGQTFIGVSFKAPGAIHVAHQVPFLVIIPHHYHAGPLISLVVSPLTTIWPQHCGHISL